MLCTTFGRVIIANINAFKFEPLWNVLEFYGMVTNFWVDELT
jgi:hypothetical protein